MCVNRGKGFGIANGGYGGIALKNGETYLFSLRARQPSGHPGAAVPLRVVLEDETGRPMGESRLKGVGAEWTKLETSIKSSGNAAHARLVVFATGAGIVDLDVVSLFPGAHVEESSERAAPGSGADARGHEAGVLPFPGRLHRGRDGPAEPVSVEESIGDIAARPENWNRWQDAIRNQTAPQYYQTYGLGFFEYFQLCEDIGAEPVPILNCGMACQYQSKQLVPLDQLDPFVQDALDLVEFANGPATSAWGAKRAAMDTRHPSLEVPRRGKRAVGGRLFRPLQHFSKAALKGKYPGAAARHERGTRGRRQPLETRLGQIPQRHARRHRRRTLLSPTAVVPGKCRALRRGAAKRRREDFRGRICRT